MVEVAQLRVVPPEFERLPVLHEATHTGVRTILRTGSAGLLLMAASPYLAWISLDFLDRLGDDHLDRAAVVLRQHRIQRRAERRLRLARRNDHRDRRPAGRSAVALRPVCRRPRAPGSRRRPAPARYRSDADPCPPPLRGP